MVLTDIFAGEKLPLNEIEYPFLLPILHYRLKNN